MQTGEKTKKEREGHFKHSIYKLRLSNQLNQNAVPVTIYIINHTNPTIE